MEREIVVRGEAEVRAMPDRATFRVVVDGEGASRDEAFELASRDAAAVDAVLRDEEASLDRVVTTSVVVQPKNRVRKGEAVRTGWIASRTAKVEITALDRVGAISAQLAHAGAALYGPEWELDQNHDAYGLARAQAGENARLRASQYALALGIELGEVAWVAEPGLRRADPFPVAGTARAAYAASAGGASEPMDIVPEEIIVRASLEVGFAIHGR
jgi:hypothetical protein